MQELLFEQSVLKYPPRPTRNDSVVSVIELHELALCEWLNAKKLSNENKEDLIGSISVNKDAYDVCLRLDKNCGWDTNSDLLDVIHYLLDDLDIVYQQNIRDWVKQNGILPIYKVGDEILFKQFFNIKEDVIVGICEDIARYITKCNIVDYELVISKKY